MVLAHLRVTGGNSQGVVQTNDPKETLAIEKVKLEAMKLKLQYELTERDNAKIKFQFEEQRREEERHERALERQHELHLLQLKASPVAPQTSEPVNFDVGQIVTQVSEIIKTLNPESTITFLDMAGEGLTRGRVYIRVSKDTTQARRFVGLCTGQPGSSFLNTQLNRVVNKGKQRECVFGGNYSFNYDRIFPYITGAGTVSFKSHSEKSGEFCISTNGGYESVGAVIGQVESGLEVLKAAVQLNDITQVTVVDCGVVVPL
ncbi:hypothetical protein Pcinc_025548 [Petrolisthes cinctipes]|uniref:PPIase cyclophilin-type domain-containing protein n=1 Tax=Petrolisthes cinctipes TaxID=88211 RepID=A0AAE1FA99_PETCI|nr:hypothetical protein Pcinc_025548 [Petrolisthes cinctipes]